MADPILPRWQSPVLDGSGNASREWYDFFRDLLALAGEQTASEANIEALAAAVAELQAATPDLGQISGDMSVFVQGLLGQAVQLRLLNDLPLPDDTHYYGTDVDGTKGWHPVADTVEAASGELTKTVDADGVTTFGLEDVTPGVGGTLQKTAFDAKGRLSDQDAADTDDLPEGSNLYFTAARVQATPLASYTVATLPAATTAGQQIYVTDETGGAVPAFSDGANWRRVTDRAVVA